MLYIKILLVVFFGIIFLYPAGQFILAWAKFNFSEEYVKAGLGYATSLSGLETLPMMKFKKSPNPKEVTRSMCTNGLYLGKDDIYVDCSERCGQNDFEYKFIDESEKIVIHLRELHGAYCLPKATTRCNLNTSLAIIGLDGYQCISRFPALLGGASGNEIVGCDSHMLFDRLTNETYVNTIPTDLILTDVDEMVGSDYRFTCVRDPDAVDLKPTYGSRFESEINVCNLLDENGTYDAANGKCQCDHYMDRAGTLCTTCTSGWEVTNNQHGSKYGFTVGRNCVDPTNESDIMSSVVPFPCGQSTLDAGGRCERGLLNITNTYTAQTLENLFQ